MTYIISDPGTKETIILDSVLDYDASSGRTSNTHNEAVVEYCTANELDVKYILESHVHGEFLDRLSIESILLIHSYSVYTFHILMIFLCMCTSCELLLYTHFAQLIT